MKTFSQWKLAALLTIVFAGSVQAGGCTGREVGSFVAGTIAADILIRASQQPPPPRRAQRDCRPVSREYCREVSNYRRGRVQSCTWETYYPCDGGWRKASVGSDASASSALNIVDLMDNYDLQEAGAQKIIDALSTAETAKDAETAQIALRTICLDVDELKAMTKTGSLSESSIDCMARSLDQDPTATATMISNIATTAREREAARNSGNIQN